MDKQFKSFHALNLEQLYQIMVLRQEVFVVEQNCPYLDADDKDQEAYHVMFWENNKLVAYSRVLPPGSSYETYSSIGRVVSSGDVRGRGIGQALMKESISRCLELYPNTSIKISAQVYLLRFYSALGFVETGDRYDEDGIPHASMILKVSM